MLKPLQIPNPCYWKSDQLIGDAASPSDMHPEVVLHLEHDGKLLLVDENGSGPLIPVKGRTTTETLMRLPSAAEAQALGIEWSKKLSYHIGSTEVIRAHPEISWPEHWAWKDDTISDDAVHPIARESVYRSLHRLVSKLIIQDKQGRILLGKVLRGVFTGSWTLPGGYMDHNEHPSTGAVRETLEELGVSLELPENANDWCQISQNIFSEDGLSFVSFTYSLTVDADDIEVNLKSDEIEDAEWFSREEAMKLTPSWFDKTAISKLN